MIMTRTELLAELTKVQNLSCNLDRDIMTIAGMMDNEQLEAHIERNRPAETHKTFCDSVTLEQLLQTLKGE